MTAGGADGVSSRYIASRATKKEEERKGKEEEFWRNPHLRMVVKPASRVFLALATPTTGQNCHGGGKREKGGAAYADPVMCVCMSRSIPGSASCRLIRRGGKRKEGVPPPPCDAAVDDRGLADDRRRFRLSLPIIRSAVNYHGIRMRKEREGEKKGRS